MDGSAPQSFCVCALEHPFAFAAWEDSIARRFDDRVSSTVSGRRRGRPRRDVMPNKCGGCPSFLFANWGAGSVTTQNCATEGRLRNRHCSVD
jgi:hypothetical protein